MSDREKMIQALENADALSGVIKMTVEVRDILVSMLKERGTVKPKIVRDWYVCECGASITVEVDGEPLHKAKFCAECGRGIEWE